MTQTELQTESCKPLKGSEHRLSRSDIAEAGALFPDWTIAIDGADMTRSLAFENYYQTIAFVNALAFIAHQQDHHPDLEVAYNRVGIRFSTHDVGGLSRNDLICAARTEALLA